MSNDLALTITLRTSGKVGFFLLSNGSPLQAWLTDDKTSAAATAETFLSHEPDCDPDELCDRLMECTQGRRAKS
jgi:hypothetical protein